MSPDYFDLAKPMRDAVLAQVKAAAVGHSEGEHEAMVLAAHLSTLVGAFLTERHKTANGNVRDSEFQLIVTAAFGNAIANAAASYSPYRNGKFLMPAEHCLLLLGWITTQAMDTARQIEDGTVDMAVRAVRKEDGSVVPESFDFMEMLNRGAR